MIDDLDRSLRALLLDQLPRVVEQIEADGFDIAFEVPNRETTSRLTRPTLNAYLYHIQENRELRPGPWEGLRNNGNYEERRPPVRLECHYLITAWSNEVEDEHRLLTGAARVFFRNQRMPEDSLQGSLEGVDHELRVLVAQPAQIKDVVDVWSVLDNDLKPSLRVTVIIPLELEVEVEKQLVLERRFDIPPPIEIKSPRRAVHVAGRLLREGEPVSGARLRMHLSSATTRGDGTFELRDVPAGTRATMVALDGDIFRLDADPPVGETPEGELLELELTSASASSNGNGNGNNGANGSG